MKRFLKFLWRVVVGVVQTPFVVLWIGLHVAVFVLLHLIFLPLLPLLLIEAMAKGPIEWIKKGKVFKYINEKWDYVKKQLL